MRGALAACAAGALITLVSGQATDFDAVLATPPTQDSNQFQLQNAVSVLISAGNVFYDADFDGRPMQAFEITDQDGNSLGPFQMPTSNYQDYIVDLSTLNTGVGLKPFHRGTKLVNATDRGWRLDYYNTGITGSVYSTVLSGPITTISPGVYLLTVDMQLRWSEEGDSLDRLGQGANSHIALALADFNSFTLTIDAPGSARMEANLFETTTTTGSPTASPTGPPVPSTSSAASTVTETPANRGPGPSGTFEGCMEEARLAAEARQMDDSSSSSSTSPRSAKKDGVLPEDRRQCEQQFRSECEHGKGKGKSKKKKKKGDNCGGKKKGKIALSNTGVNELIQRSTLIVAGAAAVVVVLGYAKMVQQRRIMQDYETLADDKEIDNNPVAPTEIKAFVGQDPAYIFELAKTFHLPPDEAGLDVPV
eukprot:m.133402 g.133402  ORF g.133402 m.133402 type:complete len:421 (+) comp22498_c0_seq1:225-1487(+)